MPRLYAALSIWFQQHRSAMLLLIGGLAAAFVLLAFQRPALSSRAVAAFMSLWSLVLAVVWFNPDAKPPLKDVKAWLFSFALDLLFLLSLGIAFGAVRVG